MNSTMIIVNNNLTQLDLQSFSFLEISCEFERRESSRSLCINKLILNNATFSYKSFIVLRGTFFETFALFLCIIYYNYSLQTLSSLDADRCYDNKIFHEISFRLNY